MPVDWSRVHFTKHMVEAAEVVAECQVAFDFEGAEQVCYEVKVLRPLKGASQRAFFAIATDRTSPGGFRPLGEGDTAEEALDDCLRNAGIHHRRRVRQGDAEEP